MLGLFYLLSQVISTGQQWVNYNCDNYLVTWVDLGRLVKARKVAINFSDENDFIENPLLIHDMNEVSELVAEIEPDNKHSYFAETLFKNGGQNFGVQ